MLHDLAVTVTRNLVSYILALGQNFGPRLCWGNLLQNLTISSLGQRVKAPTKTKVDWLNTFCEIWSQTNTHTQSKHHKRPHPAELAGFNNIMLVLIWLLQGDFIRTNYVQNTMVYLPLDHSHRIVPAINLSSPTGIWKNVDKQKTNICIFLQIGYVSSLVYTLQQLETKYQVPITVYVLLQVHALPEESTPSYKYFHNIVSRPRWTQKMVSHSPKRKLTGTTPLPL